jgi:RNA polymerase sigma factor (sigma-70 family)
MDDRQLLQEYAAHGSEAAFGQLMDRHLDLVYSAARRTLGDVPAAEDVAQSVFSLLASKARRLPAETVLVGWLYQTTVFVAARYRQSEWRRRRREQEAVAMNCDPVEANANQAWDSIAPILDQAMNGLKGEDRLALLLRFFEGKALGEVGKALGISEDAARMRVNRSLKKLRVQLLQRGVECSALLLSTVLAEKAVAATPMAAGQTIRAAVARTAKSARLPASLAAGLSIITTMKLTPRSVSVAGLASLVLGTVGLLIYNQLHARSPDPGSQTKPAFLSSPRKASDYPQMAWLHLQNAVRGTNAPTMHQPATPTPELRPAQVDLEAKYVVITNAPNQRSGFALLLGQISTPGMTGTTIGGKPGGAVKGATMASLAPSGVFPRNPTAQGGASGETVADASQSHAAAGSSGFKSMGVLSEEQFRTVLQALEATGGVDVTSPPRVTTLSGRQAQIVLTVQPPARESTNGPVNQEVDALEATGETPTTGAFEGDVPSPARTQPQAPPETQAQAYLLPIGPTFDIIPFVSADGYAIRLKVISAPLSPNVPSSGSIAGADGAALSATEIFPIPLPRFSGPMLVSEVSIWDGQTVVLQWPNDGPSTNGSEAPPRERFVFLTARIIDPAGNRVHTADNVPYDPNSVPPQGEP